MNTLLVSTPDIEDSPRDLRLQAEEGWWHEQDRLPEPRPERVLEPIGLDLEAYRIGERLLFRGQLRGRVELACGRCAEPYPHSVSDPVTLLLEPLPATAEVPEGGLELDSEDLALGRYGGEKLDFSPVLIEALLTAWPMQPRCSDGCLGLCPTCGANRNIHPCTCEAAQGGRPFEALGKLLTGARGGGGRSRE